MGKTCQKDQVQLWQSEVQAGVTGKATVTPTTPLHRQLHCRSVQLPPPVPLVCLPPPDLHMLSLQKLCKQPPLTMAYSLPRSNSWAPEVCPTGKVVWHTVTKGLQVPSICWGCFCLRPPLRAGARLGAARRLSACTGGAELGWGRGEKSKGCAKWSCWTWDRAPEDTWSLSENRLPTWPLLHLGSHEPLFLGERP